MSLAKSVVLRLLFELGIWYPLRLLFFSKLAKGSIVRLKRRHDKESPCLTPLDTWKGSLIIPLIITIVSADLYRDRVYKVFVYIVFL